MTQDGSKIIKPKTLHELARSRGLEPKGADLEIPPVNKDEIRAKLKKWKQQRFHNRYKPSSDINSINSVHKSTSNLDYDNSQNQSSSNLTFDSSQYQPSSNYYLNNSRNPSSTNLNYDKRLYQSSSTINFIGDQYQSSTDITFDSNLYHSSTNTNLDDSFQSDKSTKSTIVSIKTSSTKLPSASDSYPQPGKKVPLILTPTTNCVEIDYPTIQKSVNDSQEKYLTVVDQNQFKPLKIDTSHASFENRTSPSARSLASPINSIKVKSKVSPAYLSTSNPDIFSAFNRPQTDSPKTAATAQNQPIKKQIPSPQLSIFRPVCSSSSSNGVKERSSIQNQTSQTMSAARQPNNSGAQMPSNTKPSTSNPPSSHSSVFNDTDSQDSDVYSRNGSYEKWENFEANLNAGKKFPNSEFPNMCRPTTPSYAWYQPAGNYRDNIFPPDPMYTKFHISPMSHFRDGPNFFEGTHEVGSDWLEEPSTTTTTELYTMPPYRTSAIGLPSPRSVRKSIRSMPMRSYMDSFVFTKPKPVPSYNPWDDPCFDNPSNRTSSSATGFKQGIDVPDMGTRETGGHRMGRGMKPATEKAPEAIPQVEEKLNCGSNFNLSSKPARPKDPDATFKTTNPGVDSKIYISSQNKTRGTSNYTASMEGAEPPMTPKNPLLLPNFDQIHQTAAVGSVSAPPQNPILPPCNLSQSTSTRSNESAVQNISMGTTAPNTSTAGSSNDGVDTSSIDESFHKAVLELEQKRMEQMKVKPPAEMPLPKDFKSALKNFGEPVKTTQKVANYTVKSPSHESLVFQTIKLNEEKLKMLESKSCERMDNVGADETDSSSLNYDEARQRYGPVITGKRKSIDIDKHSKTEGKSYGEAEPQTPLGYQDARTRFGDPLKLKPVANSGDPKDQSTASQITMATLKATPKPPECKEPLQPSQIDMPALKATPKPPEEREAIPPSQIEMPLLKATPKPPETKEAMQPSQIEMPALKATPRPPEVKEAMVPSQIEMPALKATPKPAESKEPMQPSQIDMPALKATPRPPETKEAMLPSQIEMPALKATPKSAEHKELTQPSQIEMPALRVIPKPIDLRDHESSESSEASELSSVKTPVDFEDAAKRFGQLKRAPGTSKPAASNEPNENFQEAPKFGQEHLKATGAHITESGNSSQLKETAETHEEHVRPKNYKEARNIFATQNEGSKTKNGSNQTGVENGSSSQNKHSLYTPSYVAKLTSANPALENDGSTYAYPSNPSFEAPPGVPSGQAGSSTNPNSESSSGKLTDEQKADAINAFVEKEQNLKCMQQYPHISPSGSTYSSLRNVLGLTPGHQVDMVQQHQQQQYRHTLASNRNPPLLMTSGISNSSPHPRMQVDPTTPKQTGDTPKSARKAFRMFYSLDHSDSDD